MAFNNANLTLTGNQQRNHESFYWVYTTVEDQSDVLAANYFDTAFGRLRGGDIVRVSAADGDSVCRIVTDPASFGVIFVAPLETL